MDIKTDAVIIGAGPAGISAAISLQKAGVSNIVLEKSTFPREKTCGGLVTHKTLKKVMGLLEAECFDDISSAFCDVSKKIGIYFKSERSTGTEVSEAVRFVRREQFDHFLVRKYKEQCGTIYEGVKDHKIDNVEKKITIGDDRIIHYKYLVVADGALSHTRETLGYKDPKQGFCVETHIPKGVVTDPDEVRIYFGIIKKGYAWVFPWGEEVCVGLGGVYSKGIDYTDTLRRFLNDLGIDERSCKIKGAFVPYGEVVDQASGSVDTVLAGDAGGYVDPIYGEGLFFALTSGIEAAKAVISSGELSDSSFKDLYMENMAPYADIIKKGYKLQKVFFNGVAQSFFKKKMRGKDSFLSYYFDNLISEYNYSYGEIRRLYSDYKKEKKKRS